jgi:hypothetical protein
MRELNEMALIGAGIGGRGFINTEELHVMNYNEAIRSEKDKWDYAVKEEHDRMVSNKVWKSVPIDKIPEGTKIMTYAWAVKKKSNGTYRAGSMLEDLSKSTANIATWTQSRHQWHALLLSELL